MHLNTMWQSDELSAFFSKHFLFHFSGNSLPFSFPRSYPSLLTNSSMTCSFQVRNHFSQEAAQDPSNLGQVLLLGVSFICIITMPVIALTAMCYNCLFTHVSFICKVFENSDYTFCSECSLELVAHQMLIKYLCWMNKQAKYRKRMKCSLDRDHYFFTIISSL